MRSLKCTKIAGQQFDIYHYINILHKSDLWCICKYSGTTLDKNRDAKHSKKIKPTELSLKNEILCTNWVH